jgi:hypothetical protein
LGGAIEGVRKEWRARVMPCELARTDDLENFALEIYDGD